MPKATATSNAERFELKTLPEGFVSLRRLTYGEKLERKAMATMQMEGSKGKSMKAEMALMNERATLFDFQHCIVDHNLEGDDGQKLNLTDVNAIKKLDPRIGDELERLMDGINNYEAEDPDLGN